MESRDLAEDSGGQELLDGLEQLLAGQPADGLEHVVTNPGSHDGRDLGYRAPSLADPSDARGNGIPNGSRQHELPGGPTDPRVPLLPDLARFDEALENFDEEEWIPAGPLVDSVRECAYDRLVHRKSSGDQGARLLTRERGKQDGLCHIE